MRGVDLVTLQPHFLLQRLVGPADVQAVRRRTKSAGHARMTRCGSNSHARRGLDRVGDRLHRHPAARKRDIAQPCRPKSRYSCRLDGFSTGIMRGRTCGRSGAAGTRIRRRGRRPPPPARRPSRELPAALACLNTSMLRSAPGPLPYHMEKTPSYLAPLNRLTCWMPHTAVAASSSLMPGWNWIVRSRAELLRAPQRLVQRAQRRAAIAGDEAGRVSARLPGRARRCSTGNCTRAWMPDRNFRGDGSPLAAATSFPFRRTQGRKHRSRPCQRLPGPRLFLCRAALRSDRIFLHGSDRFFRHAAPRRPVCPRAVTPLFNHRLGAEAAWASNAITLRAGNSVPDAASSLS